MKNFVVMTALIASVMGFALFAPPEETDIANILSLTEWTDEDSSRESLSFRRDGSGSLDGRGFNWREENGQIILSFSEEIWAKTSVLTTEFLESGVKLRGENGVYIPGEAYTLEMQERDMGQAIADYARQFEGGIYLYGGKSPETGFDCSGLVYYVYEQFGYALPRVAADQAKEGRHVEPEDIQAGDIICFKSGGYVGHIGISLGNGQFIHAECSDTGVVISDLTGYYEKRGYEARRIVSAVESEDEQY